jgi:outer membrane protein assembly factor BamB
MTRILSLALATLAIGAGRASDHWPQFRGPNGDGHSDSNGLPLNWSETENVKWKAAIHGKGWSSPVVWGNQVWQTTATEDGHELFVVCVDRDSGTILRDQKIFEIEKPQFCHAFNSYASPTPAIEEGSIYVSFGSPGTACLETKTGKVIWERHDFVCNHYRGAGSSPILYGDLLIINFDGSDHQFVVALDKQTGKTVWRRERSIDFKDLDADGKPQTEGDLRKAFATPQVAVLDDQPLLISQGAKATYAYEPLTGREIWRVEERTSHSAGTRPVVGHGMIFVPTGWSNGEILAIKSGKAGEVMDANTDSAPDAKRQLQVVWKTKRNAPKKPSLLLVEDLLFGIEDGGVASCLDAKTGTEVWRERVGGNYSASPVYAEGRIYFFSEEGKTTVIEARRQFKVLAENQLEAGFMASPAIAGRAFLLRTRTHLYRIEK